jgi:hypothetical protein
MHFLLFLLFLIFPSHINGLFCVANGKYENDIGKFTDALYQLANFNVDNTLIKVCKVTVTLKHQERKILIEYHGNRNINSLTNNFQTEFLYSETSVVTLNIFTYVCSSNDYCDQQYIENWSQNLFNINLIQLQNNIQK